MWGPLSSGCFLLVPPLISSTLVHVERVIATEPGNRIDREVNDQSPGWPPQAGSNHAMSVKARNHAGKWRRRAEKAGEKSAARGGVLGLPDYIFRYRAGRPIYVNERMDQWPKKLLSMLFSAR